MSDSRLNQHIHKWAISNAGHCAANVAKEMFVRIGMDDMMDFTVQKSKYDVKMMEAKLKDEFVETWYADLNRINAKCGQGLNKLRTYRTFKFVYQTEEYLKNRAISFKGPVPQRKITIYV